MALVEERDNRISFIEETHTYLIDDKEVPDLKSVTQFVHCFFPEFNADKVIANMMKSPKWPQSKYYGMTKEEIIKQWDITRDEAALAGTKMHLGIENFYNNIPVDIDVQNSKEFKHFLNFYEKHPFKMYKTEWRIFDEHVKIAGSIDMTFIDPNSENGDNTLYIYDWKRSKQINMKNYWGKGLEPIKHIQDCNYWHYALQLNVYRKIIETNYDKKVTDMAIVVFHPDNDDYIKIDIPKLDKEIDAIWQFRLRELEQL